MRRVIEPNSSICSGVSASNQFATTVEMMSARVRCVLAANSSNFFERAALRSPAMGFLSAAASAVRAMVAAFPLPDEISTGISIRYHHGSVKHQLYHVSKGWYYCGFWIGMAL